MIRPRSFTESLLFSTVQIKTTMQNGATGVGTGFFFQIPAQAGRVMHLLMTNRHVVQGAICGQIRLHLAIGPDDFSPSGTDTTISLGEPKATFESLWTSHPNAAVDLCALNFSGVLNQLASQGQTVFFQSFDESFILSQNQLEDLMAVEDVIMVGYPIGLSDDVHNLPIIRTGNTASHPGVDFRGNAEGVVDMACFPGSSGSPIFLYNQTMFYDKKMQVSTAGPRQAFLGVLFAGPQYDAEGTIVARAIPTASQSIAVPTTRVMIHLGYYIKASEVISLAKHFPQLAANTGLPTAG